MVRISWPLAILLAAVFFLIGRNGRLAVPLLIVFVVWFLWQVGNRRR